MSRTIFRRYHRLCHPSDYADLRSRGFRQRRRDAAKCHRREIRPHKCRGQGWRVNPEKWQLLGRGDLRDVQYLFLRPKVYTTAFDSMWMLPDRPANRQLLQAHTKNTQECTQTMKTGVYGLLRRAAYLASYKRCPSRVQNKRVRYTRRVTHYHSRRNVSPVAMYSKNTLTVCTKASRHISQPVTVVAFTDILLSGLHTVAL